MSAHMACQIYTQMHAHKRTPWTLNENVIVSGLPCSWSCPPLNYNPGDKWPGLIMQMPTHKRPQTDTLKETERWLFLVIKCAAVPFWTMCLGTPISDTLFPSRSKTKCSAYILLEMAPIVPSSPWCVAICRNQWSPEIGIILSMVHSLSHPSLSLRVSLYSCLNKKKWLPAREKG